MAFQVSPAINISEKDATTVVAAVSTTETGISGVFRWGPVDVRTLVSNENDLVRKFGKPSSHNGETWFTASNFLAYGNALHVVRVMESGSANASLNTFSAYSNTGTVSSAPAIKNVDDYANTTLDANVAIVAKYPGALGNSLRISTCDSATAFSSSISANDVGVTSSNLVFTVGSNSATLTVVGANVAAANAAANTFASKLIVGDYLEAGNTSIGKQKLKITSISTATGAGSNSSITIQFSQPYNLTSNYGSNTVTRYWEFASLFDRAPAQSQFMKDRGININDEIHVVVQDEDGLFTGVPGQILENWPALSRASDAKTENGINNFYKDVLKVSSEYVWIGADRSGAASAVSTSLANSSNITAYSASLANGADGATEATVSLGKLAAGYDKFKSSDDVDISIILQGKARGVSADSDTTVSSNSVNYSTLTNYIVSNICEVRKDCIVVASPAKADAVNASDKAAAVTQYFTNINYASSYWFGDSGYKYQYDKYNDVYRWVPLNGDTAGCMVRTDFERDPWWSPAGAQRGRIKNVVKLAFNPTLAERDILYKAGVNPVIIQKGAGTLLYGDKTGIGRASAFDRINVRRLFIVLEKAIATAAQFALFEFNDEFTRNRFISIVEPYLRDVQGRRGIYDFKVVCDETNNTPQVIDTNSFVGDIYIKPARSINYIQLNFTAVGTGVEFNEVIGQI